MNEQTSTESEPMLRERLRAKLAEINERDARLPRALCRICGGVVPKGDGTCEPESSWAGTRANVWQIVDDHREKAGLPVFLAWRRSHSRCVGGPEITVRGVTKANVSPDVAAAALQKMMPRRYVAMHLAPDPDYAHSQFKDPRAKPWAHLPENDRLALASVVERTHDPRVPRRCREGACAWCGVARSLGWHKSPETWADGSAAPLCSGCYAVWKRRGRSRDRDRRRGNALEALSDAAWFDMRAGALRTYCDIAGSDRKGTDEPWQYAPEPLDALRERARVAHPESLPATLRDEYRDKHRAALRESAVERQRLIDAAEAEENRQEAEAAAAAGWHPSA